MTTISNNLKTERLKYIIQRKTTKPQWIDNSRELRFLESKTLLKTSRSTLPRTQIQTSQKRISTKYSQANLKTVDKRNLKLNELFFETQQNVNTKNPIENRAKSISDFHTPNQHISLKKSNTQYHQNLKSNSNEKSVENLRMNDLIFCRKCFRYIFKIQYKYHHPECKEGLRIQTLDLADRQDYAQDRLKLLEQLLNYTQISGYLRLLDDINNIRVLKSNSKQMQLNPFFTMEEFNLAISQIYLQFFRL